jgi:hypothetical protein
MKSVIRLASRLPRMIKISKTSEIPEFDAVFSSTPHFGVKFEGEE